MSIRSIWKCSAIPAALLQVSYSSQSLPTGVEPKLKTSAFWQGRGKLTAALSRELETEANKLLAHRETWSPVCGDKATIMWNLTELQWYSRPHCSGETQMTKTSVHPTCSTYLRNVRETWRRTRDGSVKTSYYFKRNKRQTWYFKRNKRQTR